MTKFYTAGTGHMTKMVATPIHGKKLKTFKLVFIIRSHMILKLGKEHGGLQFTKFKSVMTIT